MLSVLVISPNPSVRGGVSVFIESMKRHIQGCRIDSFYIGGSGKGDESAWAVVKRLFLAPLELARIVRKQSFDVVHINPSFDAKSLIRDGLLLLALRAAGFRRILFYFHGWDFGLQRRILSHGVLCFLAAGILNKAGLIAVLGEDFRDGLVAMGVDPARIIVTHTMFDGGGLKKAQAETPTGRRPFILFMSRFDPEKGARELLQAFAVIAPAYPGLDLVLAGDGADIGYLRAQAQILDLQDRVIFPGYVEGEEKWRLLRDCVLFALPTYYSREGMPVAILEAMGAGKPLLAGGAGALGSLLADPANGVVMRDVTPQKVEQGLRRLLDDADFAGAAGRYNAELAWRKYEARAVSAEIENFYQKAAQC